MGPLLGPRAEEGAVTLGSLEMAFLGQPWTAAQDHLEPTKKSQIKITEIQGWVFKKK
jgi:hypothetical protein